MKQIVTVTLTVLITNWLIACGGDDEVKSFTLAVTDLPTG